jgi:predicted Zn-ribbon and HTH transcriptional regulator
MATEIPSQSCEECGAEFTILHGEIDEPSFCPFCAADLDLGEEPEIEDWDEEEEDY